MQRLFYSLDVLFKIPCVLTFAMAGNHKYISDNNLDIFCLDVLFSQFAFLLSQNAYLIVKRHISFFYVAVFHFSFLWVPIKAYILLTFPPWLCILRKCFFLYCHTCKQSQFYSFFLSCCYFDAVFPPQLLQCLFAKYIQCWVIVLVFTESSVHTLMDSGVWHKFKCSYHRLTKDGQCFYSSFHWTKVKPNVSSTAVFILDLWYHLEPVVMMNWYQILTAKHPQIQSKAQNHEATPHF